ncbi:hypothetical protein NJB1604_15870 [Mycobacterium marinum]|nr:hypothetical protein NJB1604_15870 [Mycobacterium marinum]
MQATQCWMLGNREAGSNPVDMGRFVAHDTAVWVSTSKLSSSSGGEAVNGHGEGLRRSRGAVAGVELGASLTNP